MVVGACLVVLVSGRRLSVRAIGHRVSLVVRVGTTLLLVCRLTGVCHVALVGGHLLLVPRT